MPFVQNSKFFTQLKREYPFQEFSHAVAFKLVKYKKTLF